jgi:NADH-quinone oxidoreductase subunit G
MFKLLINNRVYFTKKKISILEACKFVGIKIPRFCYHEALSIAGNCRMCLVEIDKALKPVASCASPIINGLAIKTTGPFILKARENVLEALLINHPLDCPICDQGGECDLQDQTNLYGSNFSRNFFNKRGVEDKYCGPLIKTIMTRCIHCTRCVRFGEELCGIKLIGTLNRGTNTEIGNYISKISFSEISANVVDLCPVGALTLSPSAFQIRPWEVKSIESIDLTDGLGSNIYINYKELDIIRILPKKNKNLNEFWISDKARFSSTAVFGKNNINKPKQLTTFDLNTIVFKNLLFYNQIIFLINNEINLEALSILQKLSFCSGGKIKIRTNLNIKKLSNLHFWGFKNKVNNLNNFKNSFCFFLSSNLNNECVLLNLRIRTKFLMHQLEIFSIGNFFQSNFPVSFVRLNTSEIINIFSSKSYVFSKFFFKKSSILFYGKSLFDRIDSSLINFFTEKFPIVCNYLIHTRCNSEGLNEFNLDSISSNNFKNSDLVYNFFLEDNLNLRKNINNNNNTFYSFNYDLIKTIGSNVTAVSSSLNSGGTYLNLEQRPQKNINFDTIANSSFQSFYFFLRAFLETIQTTVILSKSVKKKSKIILRESLFSVFNEIFIFSDLFQSNSSSLICLNTSDLYYHYFYTTYPLKPVIEDFYRTNTVSKHSLPLIKCSQELRKSETNFFN